MNLTQLSKSDLLAKCEELGFTRYKSKNKNELIELINSKITEEEPLTLPLAEPVDSKTNVFEQLPQLEVIIEDVITEKTEENVVNKLKTGEIKINGNVSYFNVDAMQFTSDIKFDLIYLDPPYETNRTFTVNSLEDSTGFTDVWEEGGYREWLVKLILHLKDLLTQRGTLVFHISSENSYTAEYVLRSYFNKVQKIFWRRCHGKNTVKNKLGEVIDILFACSASSGAVFNPIYIPIEADSVWAFKNKDDVGEYSLGALKHDRTRIGHLYSIEKDGVVYSTKYGWKQSKEAVEELIKQNRIHFAPKQKNMYIKVYKHEHKGIPLSNLWTDIHSITRTSKDPRVYPTQKPQKLLERIIRLYSNEGSYILDPVCGSGTTGFVADKLNRHCVLCDINPDTLQIIKKRFDDQIYNF